MSRSMSVLIAGLLLAINAVPALASDAVVTRPADLRADRYIDAALLRAVAAGTHVDLLTTDAGWVQVRLDGQTGWMRATGLAGDAASVSALARLETGRAAPGNIVVSAGIRRIPKASKHALLVGSDEDVDSARLVAERIGIPADNVDVLRTTSDAAFATALDRLGERVQAGDTVFVYVSGSGTTSAACASVWSMDGGTWSAARVAQRLQPVLAAADKVMVVSDVRYAPSSGCAAASFALVDAANALGIPTQNIVHLQATPAAFAGRERPNGGGVGGGVFTQALVDCALGDAVARDGSASLSVADIAACMNRAPRALVAAASGNVAYAPVVGVVQARSSPVDDARRATTRAAIDAVYAQRDGRIDVSLEPRPSTLAIGRDAIDLTLTSSRTGYVYLILLGSDGRSFYLLFPNDLDRDNRIEAGVPLRLPRPDWRVVAQGPPGRDTILAIVAESERDLAPLASKKEGPFSVALGDADGRAELQWLLGRSAQADGESCTVAGKRRNLAAVRSCSDAFGAALVDVTER